MHITYNAIEMQSGQKQIHGHHQQTTAREEKVGKLQTQKDKRSDQKQVTASVLRAQKTQSDPNFITDV